MAAPGAIGPGAFARVRFVLVEPSHVGNIGSSARAVRTMGFARLAVVAPMDPDFRHAPEARALAAAAGEVLAGTQVHARLADALQGVGLAFATTGYARELAGEPLDVRAAAARAANFLLEFATGAAAPPPDERGANSAEQSEAHSTGQARDSHAAAAADIAFVFGTERTGLSNEDIRRCHACCAIPVSADCASLNLSQAVQVVAYEMRRALLESTGGADRPAPRRDLAQGGERAAEAPAGVEQTEALFAHLEQALVTVGYLDPAAPRLLMARLRHLLLRASPTPTEVDILRGVASAMILPRAQRAGRKGLKD
jgi:tRNA/rRNA methyltransferase